MTYTLSNFINDLQLDFDLYADDRTVCRKDKKQQQQETVELKLQGDLSNLHSIRMTLGTKRINDSRKLNLKVLSIDKICIQKCTHRNFSGFISTST